MLLSQVKAWSVEEWITLNLILKVPSSSLQEYLQKKKKKHKKNHIEAVSENGKAIACTRPTA